MASRRLKVFAPIVALKCSESARVKANIIGIGIIREAGYI
jgi:hypothetical protein